MIVFSSLLVWSLIEKIYATVEKQVSNLFDGTTSRGRTTMATLPKVRGQVLPTPKFQFKRHESPTDEEPDLQRGPSRL